MNLINGTNIDYIQLQPDDIWIVIEEITDMGRMAAVMPVLQFICKELHVNSAEFRSILRDTALDRCHLEWTLVAEGEWPDCDKSLYYAQLPILPLSLLFKFQLSLCFMEHSLELDCSQMHVWKPKAASKMYFLQLLEPSYLLFRASYIWALDFFFSDKFIESFYATLIRSGQRGR